MRARPLTPPKRPLREAIQDTRFWLRKLETELKKRADEADQKEMALCITRLREVSSDVSTNANEYLNAIRIYHPAKVPEQDADE